MLNFFGTTIMNGTSWRSMSACAVLLVAALSLGGCASGGVSGARPAASSQTQPAALHPKIGNARTREDHEELAGYYKQEADAVLAKAEEHERIARSYGWSGYSSANTDYVRHCNDLAARYRGAAENNLALAKLHHELAGIPAQ